MATELKLRKGTTDEHGNFIGAEAEATVDTDKNTIVVHDGQTQGGFPLATEDTASTYSDLMSEDVSKYTDGYIFYVGGRSSVGDGGEGHFRWDSSDLSTEVGNDEVTAGGGDGGIYVAPDSDKTGASGAWVRQYYAGHIHAAWYGQVSDGTTDDVAAINIAIRRANALGGGTVYLLKGTTIVNLSSGSKALEGASNVRLKGASRGATTIKVGDGQDAHAISVDGVEDFRVSSLTIDGNRVNQTSGVHGIATGAVTRLVVDDFHIRNTKGYGIGLQSGTHKDCSILNGLIEATGIDGIDVKNVNDDNEGNVIENVIVRNHGVSGDNAKAAFDLRGVGWEVSNCHALDYGTGSNNVGFRIRNGEAGETNGLGAKRTMLNNCFAKPANNASTQGFSLLNAQNALTNCIADSCSIGFVVWQADNVLSGCIAMNCDSIGFEAKEYGNPTDADRTQFTGCQARSGNDNGFEINPLDVQIVNCVTYENLGNGIQINPTADRTQVIGGVSRNNSTNDLADNGTNTVILKLSGVADKG